MLKIRIRLLIMLPASLLLVGCGLAATATPVLRDPAVLLPTVTTSPGTAGLPTALPSPIAVTLVPVTPAGSAPAEIAAEATTAVANARAVLAAQAGIDPAGITVGRVTPTEWPNSALGCEQAGRAYIEVITPGYVVELIHGPTHTLYHTGRTTGVVTCATPRP